MRRKKGFNETYKSLTTMFLFFGYNLILYPLAFLCALTTPNLYPTSITNFRLIEASIRTHVQTYSKTHVVNNRHDFLWVLTYICRLNLLQITQTEIKKILLLLLFYLLLVCYFYYFCFPWNDYPLCSQCCLYKKLLNSLKIFV